MKQDTHFIDDVAIEYQHNPLGLDIPAPRFSWKFISSNFNVVQTAYRIIVKNENSSVWDTGLIQSSQSVLVEYKGKPLDPQTEYTVSLLIKDNNENSAEASASFETGLMNYHNITADFITPDVGTEIHCPLLFKDINITKSVKKARLYATALGLYEFSINGEKSGDSFFAPFWTNYRKSLQYQSYDVTDQLKEGSNSLEMLLGKGWYKGILGFTNTDSHYGDTIAGLAELHIFYADGTVEKVTTDDEWRCRKSVITDSEFYLGEVQDYTANLTEIYPVKQYEFDKSIIIGQINEPVCVISKLNAVDYIITPNGEHVLDFEQNHTGVVRVKIDGKPGQKVTIRHAEILDQAGNFYTDNLRAAQSTDTYTLSGGCQTLCPHFTFHGYRYICVEGTEVIKEDYTSLVLCSDMKPTGDFECSNSTVNQLYSNIIWGQKSNFLDVPTDCPQRDERLGWTGDAQVFAGTAAFNFDVSLFFRKWLNDLKSEQTENGIVPQCVPNILGNQDGAACWGDAATIIPWKLYQAYGDIQMLENCFSSMTGWIDYITSQTKNNLWQTGFQFGDWLALDKEESSDRTGATDRYFVANAFYLRSLEIVRDTAKLIGKLEEFQQYSLLYQKTLKAFQKEYITVTGRMVSETQTACVLALHFNLLTAKMIPIVKDRLETNIKEHKNHLSTGFAGTPYLCHALSDYDMHDLAGTVFLNDDYPGWLYTVHKGATTIWERWNGILPDGGLFDPAMNSFNHYAYGSIGEWMVTKIAGISPLVPGYKKIRIKPMLTKGLERVKAEYESVYGKIASEYEVKDGRLRVIVDVPCNTTAEIHLPEKHKSKNVGSGHYEFEYETKTILKKERFTFESRFGAVYDIPEARQLLNEMSPGFSDQPLIAFAKDMTVNEILGYSEEARPLFQAVLDMLNGMEEKA